MTRQALHKAGGCAALPAKRGQASTEILILIGLLLLLMLPLLLYAYGRSNVAREDLGVQKAEFLVQRLASAADSVGYLGGAAAVVEEVEVPPNVKSLSVKNGRDIVLEMDAVSGKKQIVKGTAFGIDALNFGAIKKSGTYFVEIRALSNLNGSTNQVSMEVK